jgi:Flp pilus assembly protein TadB
VSDDVYAVITAISALAAAAALWHRIQEARSAKRLMRLMQQQGIEIKRAEAAADEPTPK